MTTKKEFLSGQVILVGYGRVGSRITDLLSQKAIPFLAIDANRELIMQLRLSGIPAVYGNASNPSVLVQSHIARASMLIIAMSDTVNIRKLIQCAYQLNHKIVMVIRTHNQEEAELLQKDVLGKVFFAEGEIAKSMGEYVLNRYGKNGSE